MIRHIRIWRWEDAPSEFKIAGNGGDEDWLALIPPTLADEYIPWLEEGTSFGCCTVVEREHPEMPGWIVKVGCHA